jgi:hypothetical protein
MSKLPPKSLCLLLGLGAVAGCAPLTFSEPARLDFSVYRSVRVAVVPSFTDSAYATDYLAHELRQDSGFERVTTDAAQRVDLALSVQVDVTSDVDVDGEIQYRGQAEYIATSALGAVVSRGREEDHSASADEVVEDVLDEVALQFLRPFRL